MIILLLLVLLLLGAGRLRQRHDDDTHLLASARPPVGLLDAHASVGVDVQRRRDAVPTGQQRRLRHLPRDDRLGRAGGAREDAGRTEQLRRLPVRLDRVGRDDTAGRERLEDAVGGGTALLRYEIDTAAWPAIYIRTSF